MNNMKEKVQGEGDYEAAERYNEETRSFVEKHSSDVQQDMPELSEEERAELEQAEALGKGRAKEEDPQIVRDYATGQAPGEATE